MQPRRFPPPWSVEKQDACFVIKDRDGQQLAYVYFEDEPGRRSAAKLLTHYEARAGCTPGRGLESLSRRHIWRSSNAVQRGTHIRRHNRKRFDGAVAVVRSVAAAIRALRCVS
jgi:hypothetical protein